MATAGIEKFENQTDVEFKQRRRVKGNTRRRKGINNEIFEKLNEAAENHRDSPEFKVCQCERIKHKIERKRT